MAKLKRCKKVVDVKKGKEVFCGMPLDVTGQCPEHGRPY